MNEHTPEKEPWKHPETPEQPVDRIRELLENGPQSAGDVVRPKVVEAAGEVAVFRCSPYASRGREWAGKPFTRKTSIHPKHEK